MKKENKGYTDAVGEELKRRGIQVSIDGCGCCGSPWVQIKIDGVLVVDDSEVSIDTMEDEK